MSASDRNRGNLANGTPPPVGTDAYAAWLERMQRTRGRHAAITKNLYTWSNYKHWADKVKGSWGRRARFRPRARNNPLQIEPLLGRRRLAGSRCRHRLFR